MAEVWPDEVVEEGNLAQHVFMVRKALGETTEIPGYIETVPRRGYRFVGTVREVDFTEPARHTAANESQSVPKADKRTSSSYALAVLPFTHVRDDVTMEHLANGTTEGLINGFSRVPQLRVTARNTVFRYKGKTAEPVTMGRELGVQAVLLGRVGSWANKLIVGAELVDVSSGWLLWGDTYYGDENDILEIQASIVKDVAVVFQLKLSDVLDSDFTRRSSESAAAYQAYLKGRFYWNKRSVESFKKSLGYFTEAISLDPHYALAHTGLADTYNLMGFYCMLAPHETFPKALASAAKALVLDPNLADAHAALGFAKLLYDWDWEEAEQSLKQAIQLNPKYVPAYLFYGCLLVSSGRFSEAIAAYRRALQIDPLSLIASAGLGYVYYFARRYDEAIQQFNETTEMDESFELAHVWSGWAYERIGMYDAALTEYQRSVALSGGRSSIAALGTAYALSGNEIEAYRVLEDLTNIAKQRHVSAFKLACFYIALGETDNAFTWLERAFEERSHLLVNLKVDPRIDSLRSDSRLSALIARIEPAKPRTESDEAFQNYLKGRTCWSLHTQEGVKQAVTYLEKAIAEEPTFIAAYAALIDCYLRLTTNYFLPRDDLQLAGVEHERWRVKADSRASLKLRDEWDASIAEREKKRAGDLSCHYPAAHQWHAAYLSARSLYRSSAGSDIRTNHSAPQDTAFAGSDFDQELKATNLTPAEEAQILCLITRGQIEAGNIEAGRLILQCWYNVGEWPRLESLRPQLSADLLYTAGLLAGRFAHYRQLPRGQIHAESLLNAAIGLLEQLGLKTRAAEARSELARCYHRQGMSDLANTSFLAAVEHLGPDSFELRAKCLMSSSFDEMKAGRLRDSLELLTEARQIISSPDPFLLELWHIQMATTIGQLAIAEKSDEYFVQSFNHYQQGLTISKSVGQHRHTAVFENNHGYLLLGLNKLHEAETCLLRARQFFDSFSDPCPELDETLARLQLEVGKLEVAEELINRSVSALEAAEEDAVLAESLRTQGRIVAKLGRYRKARQILDRSRQLAERCGDREGAGLALLIMMQEFPEEFQEDERVEIAATLRRLLGESQRSIVRQQLATVLEKISPG